VKTIVVDHSSRYVSQTTPMHQKMLFTFSILSANRGCVVPSDWQATQEQTFGYRNGEVVAVERVGGDDDDEQVEMVNIDVGYDLAPAYCSNIWKAQVVQHPYILLHVTGSNGYSSNTESVCTGITRAENHLMILGDRHSITDAARNVSLAQCRTGLSRKMEL
jgi:hypothetical protein